MPRFPVDIPREKVLKTFGKLGFALVREGNHLALQRDNPDGSKTPITLPNHRLIKGSTLRTVLTRCDIAREDFLAAFESI
jgi:hypothetical protein